MSNYQTLIEQQGLNEIVYQKEFLTNPDYINPDKPVVLAAGTGAGKTFTTIMMLEMFFSNPDNKGKKVIILPSSTKVLRDNFGEAIEKFTNKSFSYCVADGKRPFKRALHSDCDVICVLPQTLAGIEELPKVEWLVVDEAHKWYFADTIQGIITKTNPTHQLLLTGTPFKFNARKDDYSMYYVPVERLMGLGQVGNPLIEVVSSSVNLKDDDYNRSFDVISSLKWSYKEDKNQLVSVAKEIAKTLKTRFRTNTIGRMLGVFGIDKTIIYCYSKKQARHFYTTFQKSELAGKVLISTSENDIDSVEFAKFKNEEQYRVLLVVDRGKEGFDMPELFNIVDFTLSTNPEVILQIMGRVLRISKEQPNKQKIYYKVASMNTAPFILTLMTGVLQLINAEYYSTFTGKFNELKVPMMPVSKTRPAVKNADTRKNNNNFSTRALQYFQNADIPLTANFWNQLNFKQGDIWKTMGQTTLLQVMSEMKGSRGNYFWTFDLVKEVALKYNSRTEFFKNDGGAYITATNNNWLNEVCSHMDEIKKPNGYWTYERCKELSKQFTKRVDFQNKEGYVYEVCFKNGWLDEFIPSSKNSYSNDDLKNIALKYITKSDWRKSDNGSYQVAYKRGILDDICSHMQGRKPYKSNFELVTNNKTSS